MPRPNMKGFDQVAIRFSPDVVKRVEALIPYVSERQGLLATKTDVFRDAIMRGLRELERERKPGRRGAR